MIQGEGKGRPSIERLAHAWRSQGYDAEQGADAEPPRAGTSRGHLLALLPQTPDPPPPACLVFPRTQSGLLSAPFPEEACRGNLADQQKPLAASGLAGAAGLGLCRADAGRSRPQPPLDNCSPRPVPFRQRSPRNRVTHKSGRSGKAGSSRMLRPWRGSGHGSRVLHEVHDARDRN